MPAPDAEAAVTIEALTHRYGDRTALDNLDLVIRPGEIFGVLGPNGGGKSTLFRILATLMPPTSGRARIGGRDVVREAAAVRRRLGVVFQNPGLDIRLTVRENLRHQGHLYGWSGRRLGDRIDALLDRFDLAGRARDLVRTLSGGLRRRVELARALLPEPEVLLLDEPTTGLDPAARRDFWTAIAELRAAGSGAAGGSGASAGSDASAGSGDRPASGAPLTVLVTTHLLDEGEACDRLALLDNGRLVALDTPAALKARVGGDVIAVTGAEPQQLLADVQARFGNGARLVDGEVRIERPRGHEFVSGLVEAFPGRIESVRVSRPTLDDAFLHLTGRRVD